MSFQAAAALWWLLPLASIVVLLYLLKMRRRNVRVPATFLWPEKVEEIRANALFQRLRPSWLLFLQLLALSLAVFALARPQTMQRGLTGEVTVLVLDSSASMSSSDVKPSRFDEAKRLARDAIRSAKPGDRLALIEAGPTPRVVFPLGNDPAKQVRTLDTVQPTDAATPVGEALRLASALIGTLDGARIVLLSDGVFDRVENFTPGKAAFVYKSIGEYDDNLAVSALGIAETPSGRQLFCSVKNFGSKPIAGTVSIRADGKVIDSVKLPGIAPDGLWGKTIAAPASARVFEAFLDAPDALKSDNYAVSVSDPSASLKVLLITKGNPFLERALGLDPRVTLDRSAELPSDASGGTQYDIVVFDGVPEQPVQARGVLAMGAAGPPTPVSTSSSAQRPTFVHAEDHPLMRGVDLQGTFIDSQQVVKPQRGGRTVAESSAGPLAVVSDSPGKRQIYLAFEPIESDFPLQVGFPIFIANALDFLGGSGTAGALSVRPGQSFSLPWTRAASLSGPDGFTATVEPAGATVVVRDVKRVGRYELASGDARRTVYASLKSERESSIAPVPRIALGSGEVKATEAPLRFADFWRPLAMLALLVLGVEWLLFARRS